jgi:sulfite reductase alpha subunit-like flavoprotein
MSEDTTTPVTPTPAPPAQVATEEMFPKSYVTELRDEAAAARIAKKDAVDAAKAAVTAEWEAKLAAKVAEFDALSSESLGKDVTLAKLKAALELGVPSDKVEAFADLLKGDTEEDIKASAESTFGLVTGFKTTDKATDPTQGSGGRHLPLNSDALLEKVKAAVGAK